jgi:hemolysin III
MARPTERFFIPRFSLQIGLQLGGFGWIVATFLPNFWHRQTHASLTSWAVVIISVCLFMCFFEWFFHRYTLHSVIWAPLKRFNDAHTHHHALTDITLGRHLSPAGRRIINRYPITTEEQHEDAAFPIYALVAFWALFTLPLLGAQALWPRAPVVLGGFLAIAWQLWCYECFHSIEHYSYEWWKRATEQPGHPRWSRFWQLVYGFHHMHHANIGCNEAISGFFGLPLADWVLGTYYQPEELLLHDRLATVKDFVVPKPRAVVQRLDDWARRRKSAILHRRSRTFT